MFHKEAFNAALRKVQSNQNITNFEARLIQQVQAERNQQMLTLNNPNNLKLICDLLRISPMMDEIGPTEEQQSAILARFSESNRRLAGHMNIDLGEFGYF